MPSFRKLIHHTDKPKEKELNKQDVTALHPEGYLDGPADDSTNATPSLLAAGNGKKAKRGFLYGLVRRLLGGDSGTGSSNSSVSQVFSFQCFHIVVSLKVLSRCCCRLSWRLNRHGWRATYPRNAPPSHGPELMIKVGTIYVRLTTRQNGILRALFRSFGSFSQHRYTNQLALNCLTTFIRSASELLYRIYVFLQHKGTNSWCPLHMWTLSTGCSSTFVIEI